MNFILAFLDLYEQFLIIATLFTLVPVGGSAKKQIICFFSMVLFLFLGVRISNSLQLYNGIDIMLIITLTCIIMRVISQKNLYIIILYTCCIFMFLGFNSSLCFTILTLTFNISTSVIIESQFWRIIVTVLSKIVESFVFLVIRIKFKTFPLYFKSKKWMSLLVVEILAFICLIIFLEYYFNGYDSLLNYSGIIIATLLFAAEFYVFTVLNEENNEKQKLQIALNKIEFDHKYYKDTLAQYNEMRKLKHDMKHIYHLITELASTGKNEQIIHLIGNSEIQVNDVPDPIVTGNSYLDYVINLKSSEAKGKNIDISFVVEQIDLSFISDSDLFILIGNLLDNAIEHSSGDQKRITFSILKRKNIIFITCVNSVNCPNHQSTNKPLISTKDNPLFHGYGLQSIEMIAQKYDGSFSHSVINGKFTASISFLGKICN